MNHNNRPRAPHRRRSRRQFENGDDIIYDEDLDIDDTILQYCLPGYALSLAAFYVSVCLFRMYAGDDWKQIYEGLSEWTATIAAATFLCVEFHRGMTWGTEGSHVDQIPPFLSCVAMIMYTSANYNFNMDQPFMTMAFSASELLPLCFGCWTVVSYATYESVKAFVGGECIHLEGLSSFMGCITCLLYTFPEFSRVHQDGYKIPLDQATPILLAYLAMTCYSASRIAASTMGYTFGPYVDLLPGLVACCSILTSSWVITSYMSPVAWLPVFIAFCQVLFYTVSEVKRLRQGPLHTPKEQFSLLLVTMVFFSYSAQYEASRRRLAPLEFFKKLKS